MQFYGLDPSKFKVKPNQLEIELLYIANAKPEDFGGLDRADHIKNVIKMLYPWVWDNWHEWNELCLWAWVNYEEIGMTGCAAAHKTFTFSLLPFIEWLAKPLSTSVILTSTTILSLRGRIWNEFRRFYDKATIPFGYNLVDSMQKIQSVKGDDKFAIRAIPVDSGEIEKAIGKIQGVHPERMIMVVDEAAQTAPAIFTARANLRVGTSFYRFAAIANAVDQFDGHGKFCEPKSGWSSISVNDDYWLTKSGICLHFDGLKSPNVRLGTARFPRLFSQKEIDSTRNDFGENSLQWWSYVRGFWAPRGVRNTVLDASLIFDSKADQRAIWEGSGKTRIASLDPAFTTDGDSCILRFATIANFLDGQAGMEFDEIVDIKLIESKEIPINYQIANRVIEECIARRVAPEHFIMDATSASGLADIITQLWSIRINREQFGGDADDGPISFDDKREAKKVYKNKVTQLWFNVNRVIKRLRNLDADTSKQFCTRQFSLKSEKTILESKKEMKLRTSGESPDLADAACLLVRLFMKLEGKAFGTSMAKEINEWDKMVNNFNVNSTYAL